MTDNERLLYNKFMEYREQWLKLFLSNFNSVRINKNSETGRLEVWEWYEKENVDKLPIDKKIESAIL